MAVRARGVLGVGLAVGALFWAGPAVASPQQAGVQVALRALGLYCGPIDGQVGPLTRAAVEAAQTARRAAGHRARSTTRTRDSLGPLGRPLFGQAADRARRLRARRLGARSSCSRAPGYYHGALDGYFGPHLDAAVRAFQQRAGLARRRRRGPRDARGARRARAPCTAPRRAAADLRRPARRLADGDRRALRRRRSRRLARLNRLDPAQALLIGTHARPCP